MSDKTITENTKSEKVIYNCHIHTLTAKDSPDKLLKNFAGGFFGGIASSLLRSIRIVNFLVKLLTRFDRDWNNDVLERYGRFLALGSNQSQEKVFKEIRKQYPLDEENPEKSTKFVVLAVDTTFAKLGKLENSIDVQHDNLKQLADKYPTVIPFYAVDPRHLRKNQNYIKQVKDNVGEGGFKGIKIYPNMGFKPDHPDLIEIYKHCQEVNVPVMSHCSPGGMWKYGLDEKARRDFSRPENYRPVFENNDKLRICLAHFGGDEEWERHMKTRGDDATGETPWCKEIADMIRSGEYPNLYTDISYTLFMPRPHGEQVEYCDYLKVLLENDRLRTHIIFGSDYYMSRRELLTERELSIMLRSRLGEELYFQIANTNAEMYLYGKRIKSSTP
jgi:predicted TIM-barrel fold metal-dependent hydrolase